VGKKKSQPAYTQRGKEKKTLGEHRKERQESASLDERGEEYPPKGKGEINAVRGGGKGGRIKFCEGSGEKRDVYVRPGGEKGKSNEKGKIPVCCQSPDLLKR